MLRSLVLILLLVNGAFYAWSQGWLNELVGVKPDAQHEPQRLSLQVNPDKIVVAKPAEADASLNTSPSSELEGADAVGPAGSASAPEAASGVAGATDDGAAGPSSTTAVTGPSAEPASTPVSTAREIPPPSGTAPPLASAGKGLCVEAGPFSAAEFALAETALRAQLPNVLWTRQAMSVQGMWLVYMGPYENDALLDRKQEELKRIKGLDFEVVRTPPQLAQGISLGRFSVRENADKQLETLRGRGIRTARIVTLRQPDEVQMLRVPRADKASQVKLSGLKLPQGKGFTACRG